AATARETGVVTDVRTPMGSPRHRVPIERQDPRPRRRPELPRSVRIRVRTGLVRWARYGRIYPRSRAVLVSSNAPIRAETLQIGPLPADARWLPDQRLERVPA